MEIRNFEKTEAFGRKVLPFFNHQSKIFKVQSLLVLCRSFLTWIWKMYFEKEFFLKYDQNFGHWRKFRLLPIISLFLIKFRFVTKILIFAQIFDFWPKFRFWTLISIFDQNFDFWTKFRFLNKISILSKISIFDYNLLNFVENWNFGEN